MRRERAVVAVALAVLTLLAWIHLWRGAGMDMPGMARFALFPDIQPASATMHMGAMPVASPMSGAARGSPGTDVTAWGIVLAMWWVMMVAMMLPGAAPFVLLYGRAVRQARAAAGTLSSYAPSAFLLSGYLVAWLAFSIAAAALQMGLQDARLLSPSTLSSRSATFSGMVLIAAGGYQLSPLKQACLSHCRGPLQFLARHWRPGNIGAFTMGLRHGIWCVGCCWMLMALLFAAGIMNLAWIAILTLLVLAEKVLPHGVAVGRVAGVAMLAWGLAILLA